MNNIMDMAELRSILTETIRGVKTKKIKPDHARAIYGGTGQLMSSYKLELLYRKLSGESVTALSGFLPMINNTKKRRK